MKKYVLGLILGLCFSFVLAATVIDTRHYDARYPVAKYSSTQLTWANRDANDKSTTLANINGFIERVDIIVNDGNDANMAAIHLEDGGGTDLTGAWTLSMTTAARVLKLATSDSTDFNAIPSCGNLVIKVDPNQGPDGITWTVDFNIYVR